ncbi:constitutive coactivator of peroxisome proliferator-activated receptor gamma [Protopterus annectens]|uniref:constitutive coactivator of peroxisome proliferator-activated receptor gamma n=1 Tax=Protopterus annectens TaxID=7888 RepID=UPI001CFAAAE4|nr:constitutive coactivator of peroxisome proliferator-activated receptor gamma [Protopterus annectens]XP_043922840.1 constitutive coactivator of peroxisome proliferator-activated receptor gamma [Protopterus annectens]
MGVKGLQWFVENACPNACVEVDLKEVAEQIKCSKAGQTPTLVVDAMACLRHWYTPDAWVHGGQWREYLQKLKQFIEAFSAGGIRLVFFFDGVVELKKRQEWVRRRLHNNKEISKIFQFIKANGQQPGRAMFFIPSGLATFTRFALKSLGQDVVCSLQEADYEIASYALENNCMGILGLDSDYLIYSTAPYYSISKLQLSRLLTVMFSREHICHSLHLKMHDLPLLACLLGNDVVPEGVFEGFRRKCLSLYQPKQQSSTQKTGVISAVAQFISDIPRCGEEYRYLEKALPPGSDKNILEKGLESYLLLDQQSPWLYHRHSDSLAVPDNHRQGCVESDIFQTAREQHVRAEGFMVYNVLSAGEVECSNTLEDESDTELPGQAVVYLPARQHIYAVLLGTGQGMSASYPSVKEWFVYPGNLLKEAELVQAVPLNLSGGTPNLRTLWLSEGPETNKLRYHTFLACFNIQDLAEELQNLEASTLGVCCLLIYLALQVHSLSMEDFDAFLAQALTIREKSARQLAGIQLASVDSRAVQLGSLFVRGLTTLIAANSACGFPFKMADFMPWEVFDGKLFHQKYQQSHKGCTTKELVEGNEDIHTLFLKLKSVLNNACSMKNRPIQSNRRGSTFSAEAPVRQGRDGANQRGRGSHFQRGPKMYAASAYHDQSTGHQQRGHQAHSFRPQSPYSGRGYRQGFSTHNRSGDHFSPRWPGYQSPHPGWQ